MLIFALSHLGYRLMCYRLRLLGLKLVLRGLLVVQTVKSHNNPGLTRNFNRVSVVVCSFEHFFKRLENPVLSHVLQRFLCTGCFVFHRIGFVRQIEKLLRRKMQSAWKLFLQTNWGAIGHEC
jgi:hypothetical protein